jgi:hypothetical protein
MTSTLDTNSVGDMPGKLWEVRSTAVIVNRVYVKARTRQEAKDKSVNGNWEEVSSVSKLTANQAWYGATES